MPNAWFYYICPLVISIVFVAAGTTLFRQFRRGAIDAKGNKYGPAAGCVGVLAAVIGGAVGLGILFTSPTPWQRQRLFNHVFHTPPQRIQRMVIRPTGDPKYQLTSADVTIDDPPRLVLIASLLDSGKEITLNHPSTRWIAIVEMVTLDGTFHFSVTATAKGDRNGTYISALSNAQRGGWNLGQVRADGLETIFEDAVKSAPKP